MRILKYFVKIVKMKLLVSYSYYESLPRHATNLEFFLQKGVLPFLDTCNVDVQFVIQGHRCSVSIPHHSRIDTLYTDNTGYDLGAHGKGLQHRRKQGKDTVYTHYMFLNCGQRGPFLPSYWPQSKHWFHSFLERFKRSEHCGAVSACIFCHPLLEIPVLETWAFALSRQAFVELSTNSTVFDLHATKTDALVNGEEKVAVALLSKGFAIDCMLLKYASEVWTLQKKTCNQGLIPSRPWHYEGININPIETVFYKSWWKTKDRYDWEQYECPFEQKYTGWQLGVDTGDLKTKLWHPVASTQQNTTSVVLAVVCSVLFVAVLILALRKC